MKLAAAVLTALLITGCTAANATPAAPVSDAPIMASEGGVLRPIDNGGRVAMKSGYATVRVWPHPQSMDPRLEITVFDAAGQKATADVWVVYEMIDMDHGVDEYHARFEEGCYRMFLSFGMQGSWKLQVHVKRDGNEEIVMLVLPWVGL